VLAYPQPKSIIGNVLSIPNLHGHPPGLPLKKYLSNNDSIAVEDNSMMRSSDSVFWNILGDKNITHSPLAWEYDSARGRGIKPGASNPT